ncbi:Hypothetical protein PHPALM_12256 [Phytophthora palmivora]|uniref:Uncharacterized protein n=1 Tax=Phytophthora palmivora TaxID=4796 RepID=A0A2P4Y062_9STRA|nr:Hypothetical protein PHPALM_12256 [Phytophthora palmivora]
MGGLIARAVIEEMADHAVHTLVTLASPYYGLFYGPQEADGAPVQQLVPGLGDLMISPTSTDLKAVHAFASPNDCVAALWQTGVFGHYTEVKSLDEMESGFEGMKVLDMKDTVEYKEDSYGLRTLNERGLVFRHVVPDVPHTGWLFDMALMTKGGMCKFEFVFESYVRPVLL